MISDMLIEAQRSARRWKLVAGILGVVAAVGWLGLVRVVLLIAGLGAE